MYLSFSFVVFAMAIDPSSAKGVVGSHHESLQFFKILWDKVIYFTYLLIDLFCLVFYYFIGKTIKLL